MTVADGYPATRHNSMPRMMDLGFPPFTRAVKYLIYANIAIFLAILFAEARVYSYGIFAIKAKIFVTIWIALALFGAISERGDVNNIAHLGGALFGYLYLKLLPGRHGVRYAASEGYYGILNRFHRW